MLDTADTPATPSLNVNDMIARVCKRIPPLWDLPNYVAVNPFMGFADRPVPEAAREICDGLDAKVLPGIDWYRQRWADGAFDDDDLRRAAERLGHDPVKLRALLTGRSAVPMRPRQPVLTFAERYDQQHGTTWNDALLRNLTRWCAVEISGAGAHWNFDADGAVHFESWREAAAVDRSLEIAGLKGWRRFVDGLPRQPEAVISELLSRLRVPAQQQEAYLYRLLGGLFGFASYVRRGPWASGEEGAGPLADLLAIRVAYDAAIPLLLARGAAIAPGASGHVEDEATRMALQEAVEDGFTRRLLGQINPPPRQPSERPLLQAIFCIDVRSEPFRRHLEALDQRIETRGFAGFFGVFLDWQVDGESSARCPVLFKPSAAVKIGGAVAAGLVKHPLKHAQHAPSASFAFVEILGLLYGIGMAGDALSKRHTWHPTEGTDPFVLDPDGDGAGLSAEARAQIAAGILKNTGLRTSFGRLVLLCGHEGRSANNPHMAGLDCGACGGHGGAINARVACALLNDPAVRTALKAEGWQVPDDTWFVPGVHDTSVDKVTLLDTQRVPTSHVAELARLQQWLDAAGAGVRAERAAGLGLQDQPIDRLAALLEKRAEDWSEVRPEWALARNAAFIAARRHRTKGLDLGGRAFLHEYDESVDADDGILTLILIAPVVVASWINLQYFASTVDNDIFGCGTKTIHNRLGSLGVVLGNGGDLRTGLAAQSVHAPGGAWYHEPLRLQVVVEAAPERIDQVLAAHADVRHLVENGWLRLYALSPSGMSVARRLAGGVWEAVDTTPAVQRAA